MAHLTLQFIGRVKEDAIAPITQALQSIQFPVFDITFNAIDYFSRRGSPAILYLSTDSTALSQLAQQIKSVLQPWLTTNDHEFVDHLTLMRIKNGASEDGIVELMPTLALKPLSFKARSFSLMQSELGPKGPLYSELVQLPLIE